MPIKKKTLSKQQKRIKSYFYLIINTLCWGAAFIVVKPAFNHTTPFRFLFYRYLFAVIFSLPILIYFMINIKIKFKSFLKIIGLEIIGTTLALSLLYLGLDKTSAIEASLLANTAPIFITIAGILLLKEKEEKHEWIGLFLAFFGAILMTFLPIMNGSSKGQNISLTGNLLIIGQNITIALYYVSAKKTYQKLPKLFVSSISFYVGLISFALIVLFQHQFNINYLWQTARIDLQFAPVWIAALYMAIFGSIIGLTAYIKGQDGIEASEASLFTYLQPAIYIPLGIIFLQEKISPIQIISLMIILIGVIVAEKRTKKRRFSKRKKN